MVAFYGYEVKYHRFRNKDQNSDILLIFIYYKKKLVETLAWANGEKLSI